MADSGKFLVQLKAGRARLYAVQDAPVGTKRIAQVGSHLGRFPPGCMHPQGNLCQHKTVPLVVFAACFICLLCACTPDQSAARAGACMGVCDDRNITEARGAVWKPRKYIHEMHGPGQMYGGIQARRSDHAAERQLDGVNLGRSARITTAWRCVCAPVNAATIISSSSALEAPTLRETAMLHRDYIYLTASRWCANCVVPRNRVGVSEDACCKSEVVTYIGRACYLAARWQSKTDVRLPLPPAVS